MLVDRIYSPFPLWGSKLTSRVQGKNIAEHEEVNISSRHFPSILPQFQGAEVDDRFIKSGGYNFMGGKLNYLA